MKKKQKTQQYTSSNSLGIQPLSQQQSYYLDSIRENVGTVADGLAGSGKTYIAASMGAQMLIDNKDSKVILTRSARSDSPTIGFLPGELGDKMAPWVMPYTEVLKKHLNGVYEKYEKDERIEVVPFEFIQGRSFSDCFVILDEAQHTEPYEIETFLKRIGERTKVVICGDLNQAKNGHNSGLAHLIKLLNNPFVPEFSDNIGYVKFDNPDDIIRSEFCREITRGYDRLHAAGGR